MRLPFFVAIAACFLVACSKDCSESGIPGNYVIDSFETRYELVLQENGIGTLFRDARSVGRLTWEFEKQTEQIFLHGDRELLDTLRMLAHLGPLPKGVIQSTSGYFGITPRCDTNGLLRRIDLDIDGTFFLTRNTP